MQVLCSPFNWQVWKVSWCGFLNDFYLQFFKGIAQYTSTSTLLLLEVPLLFFERFQQAKKLKLMQ